MTTEASKFDTLQREITKLSVATDWDAARQEWRLVSVEEVADGADCSHCLCSQPIRQIHHIVNQKNGNFTEVGSVCIKQFMPELLRRCVKCDAVVGGQLRARVCTACRRNCAECGRTGTKHEAGCSRDKRWCGRCSMPKYGFEHCLTCLSTDEMTVGKHTGKTFHEIYTTAPSYCEWLRQIETDRLTWPVLVKLQFYADHRARYDECQAGAGR